MRAYSFLVGEVLAHADACEDEHEDPGEDPDEEGPVEVVGHGVGDSWAPGGEEGSGADGVVGGEKHGGNDDEHDEGAEASADGAEDGADSPVGSPGSDEHEKGVEADKTVDETHEGGNGGHVGAGGLAINIAVLDHGDVVLEKILVKVSVVEVDLTAGGNSGIISVTSGVTGKRSVAVES